MLFRNLVPQSLSHSWHFPFPSAAARIRDRIRAERSATTMTQNPAFRQATQFHASTYTALRNGERRTQIHPTRWRKGSTGRQCVCVCVRASKAFSVPTDLQSHPYLPPDWLGALAFASPVGPVGLCSMEWRCECDAFLHHALLAGSQQTSARL